MIRAPFPARRRALPFRFLLAASLVPRAIGPRAGRPNPATGFVNFRFTPREGERWSLAIYDVRGRRVSDLGDGLGDDTEVHLTWVPPGSFFDQGTQGGWPGVGVYWSMLTVGDRRVSKRIVLLGR